MEIDKNDGSSMASVGANTAAACPPGRRESEPIQVQSINRLALSANSDEHMNAAISSSNDSVDMCGSS